jgi:hypothetical protein
MNTRSKKMVATLAMVPVVATVGLSSAAPSGAASTRQQTMSNGNFEHGRTGWAVGSPRTKAAVVRLGYAGSKGMRLTKTRTGPAILSSRSNVARSPKAGQRYTVSALVRTSQPGVRGRLVLRESANGHTVKNTVKAFRATRAWHRVTMDATTRRAGTQLNVRIAVPRLAKHKALLVDNVSVLRWLSGGGSTGPNVPVPPRDHVVGKLSNGCNYDNRGIPTGCGTLLGSAYQSNTDPTSWENTMGQRLGVRRTYWGGSQVDKAVATAKSDLADGRLPWISFKLPYSWGDMAAGKGDAWTKDLATKLSKLNGPVWLAFHHEPEGDGNIKQWTAMQARLAPIVRSYAHNVAYSIVLTGWHEFFGEAQYKLDNIMPKNTKIDLLGLDVYNRYGAPTNGKIQTTRSNLDRDYFAPTSAWARAHDMAWGVAETGYTDKSATDDPTWIQQTYNELKARGGVAFTYFNSNLNSTANWALSTSAKKTQFTSAMKKSPTL